MLKDYICKTLSQYCIPGCEMLVGKTGTCNHKTKIPPIQGISENRISTPTSYIYYEDSLVEGIGNLDI